jgi:hypothetical protein
MVLAPRPLALAGALTLLLATTSAVAAAPPGRTLRLTATRMASHAHGTAVVTQIAPGDYTITITAGGLPRPTSLPTTVKRRVYIAWIITPRSTRTHLVTEGAIALHADRAATYTGRGTLRVAQLGRILVTAEPSAAVRRPTLPPEGVLISGM